MRKVIIAGASGLTGSHLLRMLLEEDEISGVTALLRRPLDITHPKLTQQIISFDEPDSYWALMEADAVYCCLGTTRKKTPDPDQYRKVDYAYPMSLAEAAAENGSGQFHFVSSLGADPRSRNFYTKLKGETERDIKTLNFRSIHIYRPSLLTGGRNEKRPLERIAMFIMKAIDPFLIGKLKRYRSIEARLVARAMLKQSLKDMEGIFIYPSEEIRELA